MASCESAHPSPSKATPTCDTLIAKAYRHLKTKRGSETLEVCAQLQQNLPTLFQGFQSHVNLLLSEYLQRASKLISLAEMPGEYRHQIE